MAEIKKVDCRGMACPQPVISTKKALDSIDRGVVITLVDNDTARENVTMFARNSGYSPGVEKVEGGYRITVAKGSPGEAAEQEGPRPEVEKEPGPVYFITSNLLGQGSPDLGQVLMKSLMVSINEMDPHPRALLFLNSGVMLTCQGSPVMDQLQSLASKGSVFISCGTCLEYYKLKEKLTVGRIGNMLEINGYLAGESKVITIA